MTDHTPYLTPTYFIDSDSEAVCRFARDAVGDATDEIEMAVRLYLAVRDSIPYDPYSVSVDPKHHRASAVLEAGRAFCVPKATLLTAAARAEGIPARPGYADVRNHLSTQRLLELTGTDLFIYHGYVELYLDGKWVKCTPAFNLSLCEKFGVLPLEFDGHADSMFHPFDAKGQRHMEYVRERGSFADVPFEEMAADFSEIYPKLIAFSAERRRADFGREAEAENRAGAAA